MNNSVYKCEYCRTESHSLGDCRGCGAALKSTNNRKVITVDVGDIPVEDAEAYIKRLMKEYWSRMDNPETNSSPYNYLS